VACRCNIKQVFKEKYGAVHNLVNTVQRIGLTFEGHHHSGLSDARNTAALALKMMHEGAQLRITNSFLWDVPSRAAQSPGRKHSVDLHNANRPALKRTQQTLAFAGAAQVRRTSLRETQLIRTRRCLQP
jgi:Exonuclease